MVKISSMVMVMMNRIPLFRSRDVSLWYSMNFEGENEYGWGSMSWGWNENREYLNLSRKD